MSLKNLIVKNKKLMKHIFSILTFALFLLMPLSSIANEFSKGSIILIPGMGIDYNTSSHPGDNKSTNFRITLIPSGLYMFSERNAVGVSIDFDYILNKTYYQGSIEDIHHTFSYKPGIIHRYYFFNLDPFYIFINNKLHTSFSYLTNKSYNQQTGDFQILKSKVPLNNINIGVRPGLGTHIKNRFFIELMPFAGLFYTYAFSNDSNSYSSRLQFTLKQSASINLNLVYVLKK